jgi:dephospho-CoA kinase
LIDADEVSRAMTGANGEGSRAIAQAFGSQYVLPNGELDRAATRNLVFGNPTAKATLEAILHPLIRAEMQAQLKAIDRRVPYVLWVVPLLVEHLDSHRHCARICVVDCDEETQIKRVQARSALSREEIVRIIRAQASREQRLSVAHDIIDNSGAIEQLTPQIQKLDTMYRSLLPATKPQ